MVVDWGQEILWPHVNVSKEELFVCKQTSVLGATEMMIFADLCYENLSRPPRCRPDSGR